MKIIGIAVGTVATLSGLFMSDLNATIMGISLILLTPIFTPEIQK